MRVQRQVPGQKQEDADTMRQRHIAKDRKRGTKTKRENGNLPTEKNIKVYKDNETETCGREERHTD